MPKGACGANGCPLNRFLQMQVGSTIQKEGCTKPDCSNCVLEFYSRVWSNTPSSKGSADMQIYGGQMFDKVWSNTPSSKVSADIQPHQIPCRKACPNTPNSQGSADVQVHASSFHKACSNTPSSKGSADIEKLNPTRRSPRGRRIEKVCFNTPSSKGSADIESVA